MEVRETSFLSSQLRQAQLHRRDVNTSLYNKKIENTDV